MAERGRLVANWYGKVELGMGNGSIWNIARMRSRTDGRTTLEEVEVVAATGRWGVVDISRGFVVESININGKWNMSTSMGLEALPDGG